MIRLDLIAGARPNFVKIAPIIESILSNKNKTISFRLIHTGQHFDHSMSGSFFDDLGIPKPDVSLEVGGGTHAEQTGMIMQRYESVLINSPADLCIVVGDVTSTMACAVTAKKMKMHVGHVEGGIRSGDRTMPEEINRLITDSISDIFFTTTELAKENLIKEGHSIENIYFVGNTMIDSLIKQMPNLKPPVFFDEFQLSNSKYFVLTLHRPGNVDNPLKLKLFLDNIADSSGTIPVIFPVHPRTRNIMISNNLKPEGVYLVNPMSYLEFNYLVKNSAGVITDSGGITEETTVMGIPCMTLRDNTERPETCSIGTNELIGTNPENIPFYLNKLKNGDWKRGAIPPLWDGHSADRIVEKIIFHFNIK